MKLAPWLALAAAFVVSGTGTVAIAAPSGHLGYLKGARAIVSEARTGRETALPGGSAVRVLTLSGQGETLYLVPRLGQKLKRDDVPLSDGMLARAPYQSARPLPGLAGIRLERAYWNRGGDTVYLAGKGVTGTYRPATRRLQRLKELPMSQSRDGRILAFADDSTIRVKDSKTGREKVIFSIKNPQPLFNALARAKNPAGVQDLREALSPDLWKVPLHWQLGAVALQPDGKRLYFSCNAGTGMGAAGNSSWALFTCDLASGDLAVLSETGTFFSRSPNKLEVSPDGKRLLVLSSTHSSAIDNACSLLIVDLLTQNSRELLGKPAPKQADTNLEGGACWSPDSKYIAFSVLYYSTEELLKRTGGDWDWNFPASAWRLYIAEAATGKIVRRINGATMPTWGS